MTIGFDLNAFKLFYIYSVQIAPAGGLQQTSLPLTAAQLQHLQATGTIMQLNQKV